jgi:Flp pilus assembly protein TadG
MLEKFTAARGGSGKRGERRSSSGAQFVELAFVLPILLLLVIGIWDFGSAFELKQELTNAAHSGARVFVSASSTNPANATGCSTAVPCSVVAAATAVQQYLTGASLDGSWITPSSPTNNPAVGSCEWTWTSSSTSNGTTSTYSLDIQGALWLAPDGTILPQNASVIPAGSARATQVTLQYPVHWSWAAPFTSGNQLSTTVTMVNIGGGCQL